LALERIQVDVRVLRNASIVELDAGPLLPNLVAGCTDRPVDSLCSGAST